MVEPNSILTGIDGGLWLESDPIVAQFDAISTQTQKTALSELSNESGN